MISCFTKDQYYNVLTWSHRTFNNLPTSWMYYLTNKNICAPIHELLMGNLCEVRNLTDSDEEALHVLYLLSNTNMLDYVAEKIPNSWIRSGYNGHLAIYPSGPGIFLDAQKRNVFLLGTDGITIDDNCRVPGTNLLFGNDINFKYAGRNYQWYRNDYVYLMTDENPDNYAVRDEAKSKSTEVEKYFCFDAKGLEPNSIIEELLKLPIIQ